jgi:hypothetical protein
MNLLRDDKSQEENEFVTCSIYYGYQSTLNRTSDVSFDLGELPVTPIYQVCSYWDIEDEEYTDELCFCATNCRVCTVESDGLEHCWVCVEGFEQVNIDENKNYPKKCELIELHIDEPITHAFYSFTFAHVNGVDD